MKTFAIILASLFFVLPGFAQTSTVDLEEVKNQKPATLTGNLWAQTGAYQVSGIPARTNNFIWSMGGNASLNLYGALDLPFSFTVGQYGNDTHRPTFGQFGVSPKYKWLTGHFGHRNMKLSDFTLNGLTFLGAGVEMNPGGFRFAAMYGRLRGAKQVQPNLISVLPTYRRKGYGVKIGYGWEDTFIDVIAFKGKDDPASLTNPEELGVNPAENLVLGLVALLQPFDPLTFRFEIAGSAFTRNVNALQLDPDDSLSVEQYLPSDVFQSNYSSRFNMAMKMGLTYTSGSFRLGLGYERIDPEYETMGAYFFLNDLRNYTITPSFGLWEKRVNLSGSLGLQENNVLGNRSETTQRFIGNGTLSYANPGKPFGFSLNYSNFTLNQSNGTTELSDTVRLSLVTSNVNLTPYWTWADTLLTRSLTFSANYQELNDRNAFTREFTDMTTLFFTGNYSHFFNQQGWGFTFGGNYNQVDVFNLDTERYGLTAGLNSNFFAGKMNGSLSTSFNLTQINGEADGNTYSGNLTLGWQAAEKLNFSLYSNLLKNNSTLFEDYLEWMGGVQVNWRL